MRVARNFYFSYKPTYLMEKKNGIMEKSLDFSVLIIKSVKD
jgi:hypothetical protein